MIDFSIYRRDSDREVQEKNLRIFLPFRENIIVQLMVQIKLMVFHDYTRSFKIHLWREKSGHLLIHSSFNTWIYKLFTELIWNWKPHLSISDFKEPFSCRNINKNVIKLISSINIPCKNSRQGVLQVSSLLPTLKV